MSNSVERSQKCCLNCNAMLAGRFCSKCGQENLWPQQSVRHLIVHFFNDLTHFDGKFFNSLKYLILRPGFLSAEFRKGRRASYLNPVRMYIFTSAVFFLLYFSFFTQSELIQFNNKVSVQKVAAYSSDTAPGKFSDTQTDSSNNQIREATSMLGNYPYRDRKEYDSLRTAGKATEGFFERLWIYKNFSLQKKYEADSNTFVETLNDTFKHTLPQIFFLSLPLLALFLKLLYRRRKDLLYTSHIIFAIHLYVFVYIARLITEFIKMGSDISYLGWLKNISIFFGLGVLYYVYRAMKIFYSETAGKTFLKYFLLLLWFFLVIMILLVVMLAFSVFKM